jgi:hypothetical protein
MSQIYKVVGIVLLMLVFGIVIIITIEPVPAYAQEDILDSIPNLDSLNIYFSEAHDEPSRFDRSDEGISRFGGLLQLAGANLNTLEWRRGIPDDADLVIIASPGSDLSIENVARLWVYIQRGGNVLLITDPLDRRGRFGRVLSGDGFFSLTWEEMGVTARGDMIVRQGQAQFVDVVEYNRDGEIVFQFSGDVPILEDDFLSYSPNQEHPITSGLVPPVAEEGEDIPTNLNGFWFDGARSMEIDPASQLLGAVPLIFADESDLYGETDFGRYLDNGYSEYSLEEDNAFEGLILALAYEGADDKGRLVLVGDGDFIRNGGGFITSPSYSSSFVYPLNAQFMMRSVAWLLNREPANLILPTSAAMATPTIAPTALPPTLEPTATSGD